jgi:hypothetical protein
MLGEMQHFEVVHEGRQLIAISMRWCNSLTLPRDI